MTVRAPRLSLGKAAAAYGVILVVMSLQDAVWLGWLASGFYQREIGMLMAESVRWGPAALFYLGFPLGLVYLALWHAPATLGEAARRSAVLGLMAFGVYDLTNLATLRGWTLPMTAVDMAWGTFASAVGGSAAWLAVVRRSAARGGR